MHTRTLIKLAAIGLLCSSSHGCSEDIEARNRRLIVLVNDSFVNDAKSKEQYRISVGVGDLSDRERIGIVCACAETHIHELSKILSDYQPEVKTRRGPYGTSGMWFSADSSLLFELKGLIWSYEDLVKQIKADENISLDHVHELVGRVNFHKRCFFERARGLRVMR